MIKIYALYVSMNANPQLNQMPATIFFVLSVLGLGLKLKTNAHCIEVSLENYYF